MKLKWFFSHRVTSMLLVLLLAFLMFPTETLAAESIAEIHVHTEECTPKLTKGDEEVVSEKDGSDEPLDEPDAIPTSGSIGVSNVLWNFDQASGRLIISGSGSCKVFQSPEDQPWSELRTQITEVWFFDMEALAIPDLAYWFTGCTSLTTAEDVYKRQVM